MNVAGRSRWNSDAPRHVRKHAHSPVGIGYLTHRRTAHAVLLFASASRPACGCATVELETLPDCLRQPSNPKTTRKRTTIVPVPHAAED